MCDKRDTAMAELPWPASTRAATDSRAPGLTPPALLATSGTPIRAPDPADSEMTSADFGNESVIAPAAPAPPPVYSYATLGTNPWLPPTAMTPYSDQGHCGPWTSNPNASYQLPDPNFSRERTVHTIYFKIWDPEINQNGFRRGSDPEHFFHKLTENEHQAHQMSDYWRSHHSLPMQHGGTPFQPTGTSPETAPPTIQAPAQHLATLLFGPHAVAPPSSSASSGSAPSLTTQGTAATTNMPLAQLRHLAVTLRDLSFSG